MQTPVKSNPFPDRGLTVGTLLRGNDLPHLERTLLLAYALGMKRTALITYPETRVSEPDAEHFRQLAARRLAGVPIAYLVGKREFYGIDLKVGPDVLIPRPETELLVDAALERMPAGSSQSVLELGTGSGAIAIAIGRHHPTARIVATDISGAALAVAADNKHVHRIENASFIESDWYDRVPSERFDIIVSNPPYIAASDPHLALGDLRFEPKAALASGADGMTAIRTIVEGAPSRLVEGGWLLFEHGFDQAERCRHLLVLAGFASVSTRYDLAGIGRVSIGQWPRSVEARAIAP